MPVDLRANSRRARPSCFVRVNAEFSTVDLWPIALFARYESA